MKKILITILLTIFSFFIINIKSEVFAISTNGYGGFIEMTMEEGKLIKNLTVEEKQKLMDKTPRKFWGWNIYKYCENVKVNFIKEVIVSKKNDSDIEMKEELEWQTEKEYTTFYDVQGKMGFDVGGSGDNKWIKFKGGLQNELKLGRRVTSSESMKKKYKETVTIKPHTRLLVRIEGTGTITNGVARKDIFGIDLVYGLFEIFTVTSMNKKVYTENSPS